MNDGVALGKQDVLAAVEAWVQERLTSCSGGRIAHGWLHVHQVRCAIRVLAYAEGIDPFLAELAALLHDVGRTEPGPEHEHGARSAALAAPLLAGLPLADANREAVLFAIRWHNSTRTDTPLLCVLRDADMLDGLGAHGIMRSFMSRSHLPPYDPEAPFEDAGLRWPAVYCSDQFLGQMAWYDRLNTATARRMAEPRIALMRAFIAQARDEVFAADE